MTTTNIKWRLDQAAKQLDDLEQEVRQQNKANHCLIKKALAEFNLHIPSSHALSGCWVCAPFFASAALGYTQTKNKSAMHSTCGTST